MVSPTNTPRQEHKFVPHHVSPNSRTEPQQRDWTDDDVMKFLIEQIAGFCDDDAHRITRCLKENGFYDFFLFSHMDDRDLNSTGVANEDVHQLHLLLKWISHIAKIHGYPGENHNFWRNSTYCRRDFLLYYKQDPSIHMTDTDIMDFLMKQIAGICNPGSHPIVIALKEADLYEPQAFCSMNSDAIRRLESPDLKPGHKSLIYHLSKWFCHVCKENGSSEIDFWLDNAIILRRHFQCFASKNLYPSFSPTIIIRSLVSEPVQAPSDVDVTPSPTVPLLGSYHCLDK